MPRSRVRIGPVGVAVLAAVLGLTASSRAEDAPRDLSDVLDGRLVQLQAGRLAPAAAPRARYVAFYFGASWCGPCRAFVPELRQRYAALKRGSTPVEIVFVSDDADCRRMADYVVASRMPWPVVACHERARLDWLRRSRGEALPGLLVYDAQGRRVITSWSHDGNTSPRRALADLEKLVRQET